MPESIWVECLQCEIPYEMFDLQNHPTPSDLERTMGPDFVEMFFKTCSPIEKVLFGRDKTLKGPDEKNLWINPADKLKPSSCGGVCITQQPSKTECLQALTHRGILDIGEKVELKIAAQHENAVAEAVRETEELERFEADARIEFHVKEALEKANEYWQKQFDELSHKFREEKEELIKLFQESRKVFCESIEKKYSDEIDKLVEKAIVDTRQEMEEKCSRAIDDELAQQQAVFQQSMEVTLNNLKANDRDRMDELRNQCLSAMDVQSHLMMCRQITELMHTMSVEKEYRRKQFKAMKEEYEKRIISLEMRLNSFVGELSREHQSKSIIVALWRKFFNSLSALDVNKLTSHEQRLYYEFQQLQCDLIENYENDDTNTSKVFTIEDEQRQQIELNERSLDNEKYDVDDDRNWIKNIDECIRRGSSSFKDSSVAVNWQRQNPSETVSVEDTFMSSIFHRISQADANDSVISKIASSIIAMAKQPIEDEKQLYDVIVRILRELNTKPETPMTTITTAPDSFVSLPKVNGSLQIKDSKEIIEKRISFAINETVEHPTELLSAIDSLEILSRRNSKISNDEESKLNEILIEFSSSESSVDESDSQDKTPQNSIYSNFDYLPSYMKVPVQHCSKTLTDEKWIQLKFIEDIQSKLKSQRTSSITFGKTPIDCESSERHSILKQNSTTFHRNEIDQEQNALFPVYEKCRETLKNMKVKSILKMLCDDDAININDIESNTTLSSEDVQPN